MDYIQKQQDLQNKANKILKDLDLISFLNKKGEAYFVGSYSLGLMSHEDIDIEVYGSQKISDFLETVNYLFKQENVYNLLNLQDFRKSIYADRPLGLYCGVRYLVKPDVFRKIDIWFMRRDDKTALELVNKIKSRLNDENRKTILKIKNEMRTKEWSKAISGMDACNAVLDKGVKDTEQFRKYLKELGHEV